MYDPDKYTSKAARRQPTQARGKERVRVILAAALELFKERGVEETTTNDIAERAHIPIGSLYRYYPNKDTIIVALTQLVVEDLSKIFLQIREHPLLPYLSWDEVLLLMADSWVNYGRLNGPFAFLYAERANPRLRELTRSTWMLFIANFNSVLQRRCPAIRPREMLIAFQFMLEVAEMGISEDETKRGTDVPIHHEAVGGIALYLLDRCKRHNHDAA